GTRGGAPLPRATPSRLRLLMPLVGLGLLAWMLARLDRGALLAAFARLPASTLLLAGAAFATNLVLTGLRWGRMLDAQGLHMGWRLTVAGFLVGTFYGSVTVWRVGVLVRAQTLAVRGVPLGGALSSCVADRVVDLGVRAALGGDLGGFLAGDLALAGVTVA